MSTTEGNLVVINADPIIQQRLVDYVTHSSAGGIAVFIGTLNCIQSR